MKFIPFLLLISLLLSACGDSSDQTRQATFYAFGTEIDVSLYGVDEDAAEQTVSALEGAFDNVNNTWHAWQPSTLTRINEAIAQDQSISVEPEVAAVIEEAALYARQSKDLFNPAAGELFALWGFLQDNWFESHPPPSKEKIQAWLASAPSMSDIHISDDLVLTSDNTHVRLGFGGFAKGTAIDTAINALKQQGINNAVINIGGDLRAIGRHGDRPWRIGIRHPRQENTMLATIELSDDESVFSSGDYERFFTYEGKRYPHILDPRSGYPARDTISATVLDTSAARADASATAMIVAGNDWPEIAASLGINHVMIVRADGQIEMTPEMQEHVILTDKTIKPVIRQVTLTE